MVKIITGVDRYRNQRPEDKLRTLAELGEPGAKSVDVARRNEVSRNLLWQWREASGAATGPSAASGSPPASASRRSAS